MATLKNGVLRLNNVCNRATNKNPCIYKNKSVPQVWTSKFRSVRIKSDTLAALLLTDVPGTWHCANVRVRKLSGIYSLPILRRRNSQVTLASSTRTPGMLLLCNFVRLSQKRDVIVHQAHHKQLNTLLYAPARSFMAVMWVNKPSTTNRGPPGLT